MPHETIQTIKAPILPTGLVPDCQGSDAFGKMFWGSGVECVSSRSSRGSSSGGLGFRRGLVVVLVVVVVVVVGVVP